MTNASSQRRGEACGTSDSARLVPAPSRCRCVGPQSSRRVRRKRLSGASAQVFTPVPARCASTMRTARCIDAIRHGPPHERYPLSTVMMTSLAEKKVIEGA